MSGPNEVGTVTRIAMIAEPRNRGRIRSQQCARDNSRDKVSRPDLMTDGPAGARCACHLCDFSNPVKRHSMCLAIIANESEGAGVLGSKIEISKRQDDQSFLNTVEITDLKVAARKLLVPSNTICAPIQAALSTGSCRASFSQVLNQSVSVQSTFTITCEVGGSSLALLSSSRSFDVFMISVYQPPSTWRRELLRSEQPIPPPDTLSGKTGL